LKENKAVKAYERTKRNILVIAKEPKLIDSLNQKSIIRTTEDNEVIRRCYDAYC